MTQFFDTAAQPIKVKPVPEPAGYGAVMVAVCLIAILLARRKCA